MSQEADSCDDAMALTGAVLALQTDVSVIARALYEIITRLETLERRVSPDGNDGVKP